jgi:DNA invertase Pin-like site-specific DNA recombinase
MSVLPPAAVYCRVSTRKQEDNGSSLDTQETACRAHAAQMGYDVTSVYREVYSGAELFDRPELNRLREDIRAKKYRAVVVYAVDRLTRAQGLTAYLLGEFERQNTELLSVTDPLEKTKEGKLILGIKEYVAEVEREKIRERSLRGKRARVLSGKLHNAAHDMYGYQRIKDKENPNEGKRLVYEPEAAIVRDIFEWVTVEGAGTREVARRLNQAGIPAPTVDKVRYADPERVPVWGKSTIRRILVEPAYKGVTIVWKSRQGGDGTKPVSEHITLPDDTTPAIVTPRTWDDAQRRLASNRGGAPRESTREYLLRGLLFCSVCGGRMRTDVERGRMVYRCGSRDSVGGRCGGTRVPAESAIPLENHPRGALGHLLPITPELRAKHATLPGIDTWIWADVSQALKDPARVQEEVERRRQEGPNEQAKADVENARRQIAKVEREQARLVALYASAGEDFPLDAVKLQIQAKEREKDNWRETLARRQGDLDRDALSFEQLEDLSAYCQRVAANLDAFDFSQKRFALEALDVLVVANGREWDWHSDTLVKSLSGVEFTTCFSRGLPEAAKRCWRARYRRSSRQ